MLQDPKAQKLLASPYLVSMYIVELCSWIFAEKICYKPHASE